MIGYASAKKRAISSIATRVGMAKLLDWWPMTITPSLLTA
jgi:hypothetical protein